MTLLRHTHLWEALLVSHLPKTKSTVCMYFIFIMLMTENKKHDEMG